MSGLQQLLAPVARSIMAATQQSEGRRNASFNALKLVAEALQALSWLAYTGPSCGESQTSWQCILTALFGQQR